MFLLIRLKCFCVSDATWSKFSKRVKHCTLAESPHPLPWMYQMTPTITPVVAFGSKKRSVMLIFFFIVHNDFVLLFIFLNKTVFWILFVVLKVCKCSLIYLLSLQLFIYLPTCQSYASIFSINTFIYLSLNELLGAGHCQRDVQAAKSNQPNLRKKKHKVRSSAHT